MLKSNINNHQERSRISAFCKDGVVRTTFFTDMKNQTNYDMFQRGLRLNPKGACLGTRHGDKYEWLSYETVNSRAINVGAFLVRLGLEAKKSMVGIYSKNRWELDATNLACYCYSLIPVPIYDTLGKEACSIIVCQTECKVVCVDGSKPANDYVETFKGSNVETIIYYTTPTQEDYELVMEKGFKVLIFEDLYETVNEGEQKVELNPSQEDDLACLLYTSGTTGTPKGVMLTHRGFAAVVESAMTYLTRAEVHLSTQDVVLSYLPSAHAFNSVVTNLVLVNGGAIGYYSGTVLKLAEDLTTLKPTFLPIVPRLLNRFYDKITQGVESAFCLKQWLFNKALNDKWEELENGVPVNKGTILSNIVFKKVRETLGGRVKGLIIGSAPVSGKVLNFCRIAFGCEILEAYGQTETTGGATATFPFQYEAERVGPPIPCNECKLVSIPEMNYFTENDEGEVCFRGANIFKGYFKDEEKTRETLDEDGWLHTGDVGKWLPDGSLKIIDRKKHIFKLSQGEYIAPEKLESVYVQIDLVAQIFLHGDSLESCTVAVIVLDEDATRAYCKQQNLTPKDSAAVSYQSMCQMPEIKTALLEKIKVKAKENGFNSLEIPKDIHVTDEMFSIDNGLLTPTLKNKRPELRKYYQEQLAQMYRSINS